jgi:Core-2/I-Branching enzyme
MHIAYLILVHDQPSHLARLIKALSSDRAYFFIHIDLKAPISPFKELMLVSKNIIFLENPARVKVYWRGYSIIIATLNLLRAAMDWGVDFTRYCLLSGSDFPLKKNSHIEEVFSTSTEFLRVDRKLDYNQNDDFSENVKYVHLYDSHFVNPKTSPSRRLSSRIEKVLRKIPRKRYQRIPLYQGSQWWALTDRCVRHIFQFLKENSDYRVFHKYTRGPDEIFFHSIIKSSPFADYIAHDAEKVMSLTKYFESNEHGCHYINWNSKGVSLPKVLDVSDTVLLKRSAALFARKFEEGRSSALLNQLEEMIQGNS